MKTIMTESYGPITVDENCRITFRKCILGFENFKNFYLVEIPEMPYFYRLQSEDSPNLAFIVCDPALFIEGYNLDVYEEDLRSLELAGNEKPMVFSIVKIPDNPEEATINLLGPLLVNPSRKIAVQAISRDSRHSHKTRLIQQKEAVLLEI